MNLTRKKIVLFFVAAASSFLMTCIFTGRAQAALNPHPRLFLTPERLARIQSKATNNDADFLRLKATIDFYITTGKTAANTGADNIGHILLAYATMYKATGDPKYLTAAIASMDIHFTQYRLGPNWPTQSMNIYIPANNWGGLGNYSDKIMYMAIAYDWLYMELTDLYPDKKANYKQLLEEYGDVGIRKPGDGLLPATPSPDAYTLFQGSAWTNYASRWIQSISAIGYALAEDSPQKSTAYLNAAKNRFDELSPLLKTGMIGDGGGSFEGTYYGRHQDGFLRYAEIVWTATGIDLYAQNEAYFKQRAYYLAYLYHWWDFGGGAYPFRLGDFTEYGRIDGFSYKDDHLIEIITIMDHYPNDIKKNINTIFNQYTKNIGIASTRGTVADKTAILSYWELIYNSPSISQGDISGIPLVFQSPGTGEIIIKSNWEEKNGVTLHFKSGNHNSYHEHVDQNSFQLSAFGGEFALHSGNYNQARDDEQVNYAMRTISTNSILILDPEESFREIRGGDVYNNDGGQRGFPYSQSDGGPTPTDYNKVLGQYANVYGTGRITRFESDKDHVFLTGDATNAYNNPAFVSQAAGGKAANKAKATQVERDIAFLRPASTTGETYLIILDRVNVPAARAAMLTKRWLLHSMKKPVISGQVTQVQGTVSGGIWEYSSLDGAVQIDDGNGRLFVSPIFPEPGEGKLILTGGSGYEQWADGANHPPKRTRLKNAPDGSAAAGTTAYYGQWRIEMQPLAAQESTLFLNVLMPTRSTTPAMPETHAISVGTNNIIGVCIKDTLQNRVAVFSSNPNGVPPIGTISYTFNASTQDTQHHVFNLKPGATYDVTVSDSAGGGQVVSMTTPGTQYTASQAGAITFMTNIIPTPAIRKIMIN